MPQDSDGNAIDWQWFANIDVERGLGAALAADIDVLGVDLASLHPDAALHEAASQALGEDYRTRKRVEAMLKQATTTFMRDFERTLDSFALARAVAWLNRRLCDEIAWLRAVVRATQPKAADESSPSHAEPRVDAPSTDHTGLNSARSHSSGDSSWRNAYLPGRDVDTVVGVDIETTGVQAYRDYIIDVGFELMNLQSPSPDGHTQYAMYADPAYAPQHAYGQARLAFGVPRLAATLDNEFIRELTGIDVRERGAAQYRPFDEWPQAQQGLLNVLMQHPYVAHNATFEHKFFMFNIAGYAEAYRDGHITIIDTLPMSRQWDAGSMPDDEHPYGDNRLEAYAQRMGSLPTDMGERHLGLEDAHIMLEAMRTHLAQLKQAHEGPFAADGSSGVGGKRCRPRSARR
ncbi:hypothetical protein [Bifidobacterium gallicum]